MITAVDERKVVKIMGLKINGRELGKKELEQLGDECTVRELKEAVGAKNAALVDPRTGHGVDDNAIVHPTEEQNLVVAQNYTRG